MNKEDLIEKMNILNKMIIKHQAQLQVLLFRYQNALKEYNSIINDEMEKEDGETLQTAE